jgi:hypothetical protein
MSRKKPVVKKPFRFGPKLARFVVDPMLLMASVLPPGNDLVGHATTENGMLVFEFIGIDVPEEAADPTPMLMLMGHTDAVGQQQYWFEPEPRQHAPAGSPGRRGSSIYPA